MASSLDNVMVGVILAAGKGARMYPFSERSPKPILPILNRPLLAHQIEVMRDCGGTQVTAAKRLGINRNTLHKKWEQYKTDDRAAAPAEADTPPPGEAAAG